MRIVALIIMGLFGFISSIGQVVLSREVISCGSLSLSNGDTHADATIGESVIETLSGEEKDLTQGFQQPLSNAAIILFNINLTEATCPTSFDAEASVKNISGCGSEYQVSWSTGDTGLVATDLAPGLYTVTISSQFCETTREFEILSGPAALCEIKFFNAFSPNGDGVNDTWIIQNIDSPEFSSNSIEIFNRWGQLIWNASAYDNRDVVWNGSSNSGVKLSEGTYYYIAKIGGVNYKGYIELTR